MSSMLQQLGIDQLDSEERLELISEIWESLSIEEIEIPESHRQELDRRIAAADANPTAGKTWDEVRTQLREKE